MYGGRRRDLGIVGNANTSSMRSIAGWLVGLPVLLARLARSAEAAGVARGRGGAVAGGGCPVSAARIRLGGGGGGRVGKGDGACLTLGGAGFLSLQAGQPRERDGVAGWQAAVKLSGWQWQWA